MVAGRIALNAQLRIIDDTGIMDIRDHTQARSVPLAALMVLRRNGVLILIVATLSLLVTVSEGVMDPDGLVYWATFVVDLLFWSILGVVVYGSILRGASGISALSVPTVLRFYWRDVGLLVCALVPGFMVAMVVSLLISILFGVEFVSLEAFETSLSSTLILFVAYALCMLVILSFAGTWLASVVADGDRRLTSAFRRGETTFEGTIAQLLIWVMPLAFATAIAYWMAEGAALLPDGTVLWNLVAAKALTIALELLRLVLVAVVISRVYVAHEATAGHETPMRSGTAT